MPARRIAKPKSSRKDLQKAKGKVVSGRRRKKKLGAICASFARATGANIVTKEKRKNGKCTGEQLTNWTTLHQSTLLNRNLQGKRLRERQSTLQECGTPGKRGGAQVSRRPTQILNTVSQSPKVAKKFTVYLEDRPHHGGEALGYSVGRHLRARRPK